MKIDFYYTKLLHAVQKYHIFSMQYCNRTETKHKGYLSVTIVLAVNAFLTV